MFGIGLMILLAQPAFAEELGQANITPHTKMAEIRSNPSIVGAGIYTYSLDQDRVLDRMYWDAQPLSRLSNHWTAQDAEEIAQDTSRDGVELYYLPAEGAQANQKYALVIGGNAIVVSAEIREGISTAWNLHEMGYPVFVLRYRIGMKASNNAPLQDVVRAVQYITEHAGQFGVQAEDYAIVSYSSGGQIAGLFGTDAVGYKNYGLPKPGAMLLGYPVNTFLEFKPVYNILLDPGVCKQRYYKMTLSDYITPDYPPTYHWYGKNDMTLMTMCWSAQGPVLEKALARNHVTHIYHVYDDAPHAVAAGFWEEQVG